MKLDELLSQVMADGVSLELTANGTIKARGVHDRLEQWAPILREYKPAIIERLSGGHRRPDLKVIDGGLKEGTRVEYHVKPHWPFIVITNSGRSLSKINEKEAERFGLDRFVSAKLHTPLAEGEAR